LSRFESARIGFISARPAFANSVGIYTDAGLGRLVDALNERCGSLDVALASVPDASPLQEHCLSVPLDRFQAMPQMRSLAHGFWRAPGCRRVIESIEARADALIVQLPFAAPLALLRERGPRLYQVCADVLQQARTAQGYKGIRRGPALAVGSFVDRLQRRLICQPGQRVVTHGEYLHQHFGGEGRAVVSSAILEEEIESVRRKRPTDAPFRVLFVGYLRHEKGIDTLLAAFDRLRRDRPNAELVIVGGRDMVDTGVEHLLAEVGGESVRFTGPIGFGPDLFRQFADADVLAVPSRSEGTPRVLIEARALGCPVVASAVGGIPTSIDDGVDGLLFPAGDSTALAERFSTIANDTALRDRLVNNGLERARRTTVSRFAEALLEELDILLENAGKSLGNAARQGKRVEGLSA